MLATQAQPVCSGGSRPAARSIACACAESSANCLYSSSKRSSIFGGASCEAGQNRGRAQTRSVGPHYLLLAAGQRISFEVAGVCGVRRRVDPVFAHRDE